MDHVIFDNQDYHTVLLPYCCIWRNLLIIIIHFVYHLVEANYIFC